eukprot:CAMPEP_0183565650 /NCGR_PEP_ID=MMETSP0371-20130417/109490_1 /TAXON_ID=268820 /ORGANISM="Peridinium aciculiferum, Strain PAER-2" /LENGTH=107 /DNA_ID=CAMNT_0025774827 /DNA_START=47 /DNA_END=370 /DNA_ORIENTATION=+
MRSLRAHLCWMAKYASCSRREGPSTQAEDSTKSATSSVPDRVHERVSARQPSAHIWNTGSGHWQASGLAFLAASNDVAVLAFPRARRLCNLFAEDPLSEKRAAPTRC